MSERAFTPRTATQHIAVTTSASAAVQPGGSHNYDSYRITVVGSGAVALTIGDASVGAPVIPAAGAATGTLVLVGGSVETFRFPPGSYFRSIIGTGTADLYIVAGVGE